MTCSMPPALVPVVGAICPQAGCNWLPKDNMAWGTQTHTGPVSTDRGQGSPFSLPLITALAALLLMTCTM